MVAGRRKFCELYTKARMPVYSYRFDTPLWNAAVTDGAKHFVNVVFSFQNISGALGPLPQYQNYTNLSRNIGKPIFLLFLIIIRIRVGGIVRCRFGRGIISGTRRTWL
jgi:hypothetical protein